MSEPRIPSTLLTPRETGALTEVVPPPGGSAGAAPGTAHAMPERLGAYRLVREVGRGGMGVVFEAEDTILQRRVALKVPRGNDPDEVERLLREARTAASFSHPNVAAIYEVGSDAGRAFIAMQFVDGRTLASLGGADRRLLVSLLRDAALAVHAAHERGIVHRDLKPQNLMVEGGLGGASPASPGAAPPLPVPRPAAGSTTAPGSGEPPPAPVIAPAPTNAPPPASGDPLARPRVYVMDFGLAKQTSVDASVSMTGRVVGTPAYMPPEQARGQVAEVDARSDVYSLGATLYELLMGLPPVFGRDIFEVLRKVVEDEPLPMRRHNRGIDRDLETVVMKCLDKDKARRYPTALALAEDLEHWLQREPIRARPASVAYVLRKRATRQPALTLAVLSALVLALALGVYYVRTVRQREEANLRRAAAAKYEEWRLDLKLLRMRSYRPTWKLSDEEAQAFRQIAEACAEQMERTGKSAEAWELIGLAHRARGDLNAAQSAFVHGCELDPKALTCRLGWARATLDQALWERIPWMYGRDWRLRVEGAAQQAVQCLAGDHPPLQGTNLEYDLAVAYREVVLGHDVRALCEEGIRDWGGKDFGEEFYLVRALQFPERGVEDATKAIQLRPGFLEAYLWRGLSYERERKSREAIADYERATQLNPQWASAWLLLGNARNAAGDPEAALQAYGEALARSPEPATVYAYRAALLEQRGRLKEAVADYERLLELDPSQPIAWFECGEARRKAGDLDRALGDYAEAVRRHPGYVQAWCESGLLREELARAAAARGGEAVAEREHLAAGAAALDQALELAGSRWSERETVEAARERMKARLAELAR